jgi:ribosomal-protein-alanine N-acetyltransferase
MMRHRGTVTIETDRLLLRKFRLEDVDAAYRNWMSDGRVTKFLSWPTHTDISVTGRVIGSWLESADAPDCYQWAIVLKELGEPIGTISVVDKDEDMDMVEIGYCIGCNWWRRGITSEAFAAIIPYLFDEVGVNRIEAWHDPDNPGSGGVMRKCGLKYEGTLRKAGKNNRGIVDKSVYGLLKSEWVAGIQH